MLNKKIIRDIWKNKSQFITVFLMVFLAVFAFAGVHGYMDGMKASSKVYYNNQNLQDIWLTSENFKTDTIDEIKKIDNVNSEIKNLQSSDATLTSKATSLKNLNSKLSTLRKEYRETKSTYDKKIKAAKKK